MKNIGITILFVLVLMLSLGGLVSATNTAILVDVSGSMEGMSKNRDLQSLRKVKNELQTWIDNNKDSIQFLSFTDEVKEMTELKPASEYNGGKIDLFLIPKKGNTDISIPLNNLNKSRTDRIILISDGLHNIGDYDKILDNLKENKNIYHIDQYFLLLDENDREAPLVQDFIKSEDIQVITSLFEIDNKSISIEDENSAMKNDSVSIDNFLPVVAEANKSNSNFNFFIVLFWIIIGLLILVIAYGLIKNIEFLSWNFGRGWLKVDFFNKLVNYWLERKWLKWLKWPIYNHLPKKIRNCIDHSYDNRRLPNIPGGKWSGQPGNSIYRIPKNTILSNGQTYEEYCRERGINPNKGIKYCYGEPDFKKAGFVDKEAKLKNRDFVNLGTRSKIQEKAYEIMGIDRKYYDDGSYNYPYKDDNNLVPHEKADCKTVQLIPGAIHDLFRHAGGMSRMSNVNKLIS